MLAFWAAWTLRLSPCSVLLSQGSKVSDEQSPRIHTTRRSPDDRHRWTSLICERSDQLDWRKYWRNIASSWGSLSWEQIEFYNKNGFPVEFIVDCGFDLKNIEQNNLMTDCIFYIWGPVRKSRTLAMHPQSNAPVERLNWTLTKHLAQFVNKEQSNWDEKILWFLMPYRSVCNSTTKLTLAQLIYGRDLCLPEVMVQPPSEPMQPNCAYMLQPRKQLEDIKEFAQNEAGLKMHTQKKNYDWQARTPAFKEGDWVCIYNPQHKQGLCPRLQAAWTGKEEWFALQSQAGENILSNPCQSYSTSRHSSAWGQAQCSNIEPVLVMWEHCRFMGIIILEANWIWQQEWFPSWVYCWLWIWSKK